VRMCNPQLTSVASDQANRIPAAVSSWLTPP
jgi:hypothetical protein